MAWPLQHAFKKTSGSQRGTMKTSFRPETDDFTFVNNWNYDNTEKATIKDALAGVSTGLAAALAPIYAPVLGLAAASVSPLDVFVSFLSGGP